MDVGFSQSIITGLITGAFSAGAIWATMRTQIAFMQREIDAAHARLERHEERWHPADKH
jgi:hypothetical protein